MERTDAGRFVDYYDTLIGVPSAIELMDRILNELVAHDAAIRWDDKRTHEMSDGSYLIRLPGGYAEDDFDWMDAFERVIAKLHKLGLVTQPGCPCWDQDEVIVVLGGNHEVVTVARRVGEKAVRIY